MLETERLVLRSFTLADAPEVQRLAGDRDIASTTLSIPHPYLPGMAEQWIQSHHESYQNGHTINFAIVLHPGAPLIGSIGLHNIHPANCRAELGYWIGKPYWNHGYCTEAARAVLQYAFGVLGLNRIFATHVLRNPASGRVMQKLGMSCEGRLRQHVEKWGRFEDLKVYGILKSDYDPALRAVTL